MQSLSSILAPTASAARHLAQALTTARSDFATQANKTRRHVAGDLGQARDEVGEAAAQLSEVLGDAVSAIRQVSATYLEDAHRIQDKRSERKLRSVSTLRRHPYLATSIALGLSFFALRALQGSLTLQSRSAAKRPNQGKQAEEDGPTKSRRRRARQTRRNAGRKEINGAGETVEKTSAS